MEVKLENILSYNKVIALEIDQHPDIKEYFKEIASNEKLRGVFMSTLCEMTNFIPGNEDIDEPLVSLDISAGEFIHYSREIIENIEPFITNLKSQIIIIIEKGYPNQNFLQDGRIKETVYKSINEYINNSLISYVSSLNKLEVH